MKWFGSNFSILRGWRVDGLWRRQPVNYASIPVSLPPVECPCLSAASCRIQLDADGSPKDQSFTHDWRWTNLILKNFLDAENPSSKRCSVVCGDSSGFGEQYFWTNLERRSLRNIFEGKKWVIGDLKTILCKFLLKLLFVVAWGHLS